MGVRELAKRICDNCAVFQRYNARDNDQLMGDLLKFRVNAAFPIYEVGCHFVDPILDTNLL